MPKVLSNISRVMHSQKKIRIDHLNISLEKKGRFLNSSESTFKYFVRIHKKKSEFTIQISNLKKDRFLKAAESTFKYFIRDEFTKKNPISVSKYFISKAKIFTRCKKQSQI